MMATHFRKEGYSNIRADLPGYVTPDPVSDRWGNYYIPDLTCTASSSAGQRIILEAETCGTINDSHTEEQWKAFARAGGEFHVVVPATCGTESGRAKAESRLRQLGIAAQVWTPKPAHA